jgi:glycosyltransferase involved in cell wall biosynthesis
VIATRGPSRYFGDALASALAEQPAEVVVVEDGTAGVDEASLGRARLLRLDHVGRSAARNAGVQEAKTPFVAFLDDDDLALPGRLQTQRAALRAGAQAVLSFGRVRVVDASGHPLDDWNELLARRFDRLPEKGARFVDLLAARCPIYTSATMVRRDAFLAVGGYDPELDAYEDADLYLRLSRSGLLVPCPGPPVSAYRLHGANTPSDRLYEGALAVTAKHLPGAQGRARRLLVEWRLDALWGLGRIAAARREAAFAAARDPLLLVRPRFVKRLLGAALPTHVLEARR